MLWGMDLELNYCAETLGWFACGCGLFCTCLLCLVVILFGFEFLLETVCRFVLMYIDLSLYCCICVFIDFDAGCLWA